jgi:hypothetical protein
VLDVSIHAETIISTDQWVVPTWIDMLRSV